MGWLYSEEKSIQADCFIWFLYFCFSFFIDDVIPAHDLSASILTTIVRVLIITVSVSILIGLLNSFFDIYNTFAVSKTRPIKGYMQVAKIVIYILAAVSVISVFLGDNGFGWLAGFGAFQRY